MFKICYNTALKSTKLLALMITNTWVFVEA